MVFPNPAKENLNIIIPEINFNKIGNFATVEIMNISGEVLKQEHIYSPTIQINLSNISSGIYFINVKTSKGIISKKIIIQ